MAVALTAINVPIPSGPTAQYLIPSVSVPSKNAPQSEALPSSSYLSLLLNQKGTRDDISSCFAGGFGIINGLVPSVSSGLLISVSAGQANIYGVVQLAVATTISLPDNTARVFIWLKSDYSGGNGTTSLTTTTSTTPPSTTGAAGQCVMLGSCVTSGGAVTGPTFDYSGVVYLSKCGLPYRETADVIQPADSPGSGVIFMTSCPGGDFLFDGTRYTRMTDSGVFTATTNATLTTAQTKVMVITASGAGNYTLTVSKELRQWVVRNPTAGTLAIYDGAVTITVAAGKVAIVGCDNSAVYRITADV